MTDMLTLDLLKSMEPDSIISWGIIPNHPEGLYMTDSNIGKELIWVAKRGGYHDWAIYTHWAEKGIDYVLTNGDKVTTDSNIKKLVPCDEEALRMYRK